MKLTFIGAAQEVTGSCFLIEADGVRFLVDCGMFQGGREARERNHDGGFARGGSGCPNTEAASISGALRVRHRCRVVHGGGRTALATYRPTAAVGNSCSPLKLPV